VLVVLATAPPLDAKYRDHGLSGDSAGYRKCHVKPDLLRICRKADADTLRLALFSVFCFLFYEATPYNITMGVSSNS